MSHPRSFRASLIGLLLTTLLSTSVHAGGEPSDEVVMYKDPNCGCCGAWAEHMREHGFSVREIATQDMQSVKADAGVPQALGSCHTAKVGGYFVEGHVPAADVRRLLEERPDARGLSVPGMPLGSPGMEGPYPAQRYEVILLDAQGQPSVFSSH